MDMKQRLLDTISHYHNDDMIGDILDDIKTRIDQINLNRVLSYSDNIKVVFTRIGDTATMHITQGEDPDYSEELFVVGF